MIHLVPMANSDIDVAVIGAGAAGIAAGRRLRAAGVACRIFEARDRVGGRALARFDRAGRPMDLGCGWLHSADRNPWVSVAERLGFTVDRTPPPWAERSRLDALSADEQSDFSAAQQRLDEKRAAMSGTAQDRPVADLLDPGNRWNPLIEAVSTYYSGAETARISAIDLDRYDDTGVNWRVRESYGRTIAVHSDGLPIALSCPVHRIDRSGRKLGVETAQGVVTANAAIVTLPSRLIAEGRIAFTPELPDKAAAAAALPLGLADKLYLTLEGAEAFDSESRAFGRTDRAATGAYHFRPFGHPWIECYFGGALAASLEQGGQAAFLDFAASELVGLFGSDFAKRIAPMPMHLWASDPFAGGSYSYAVPGGADMRAALAEPVENRLFFAGEACSRADFSTAHGAYLTGVAAADQAIASLKGRDAKKPSRS